MGVDVGVGVGWGLDAGLGGGRRGGLFGCLGRSGGVLGVWGWGCWYWARYWGWVSGGCFVVVFVFVFLVVVVVGFVADVAVFLLFPVAVAPGSRAVLDWTLRFQLKEEPCLEEKSQRDQN